MKKPQNVYLPIDRFQAKVFKNRDSQKRGEWVENFALALAGESKDEFAESLLSEAQYNLYKDIVRQWRFKAKQELFKELGNKEPTEAQVVERCIENYGEEFIEAFELVGKKDKRKRNHSKTTAGAPNGNNGDESATASNPLALDMPGTDKASNQGESNTGNAQPSGGPEDGNLYDQEPDKESTDEKGGFGPLEKPNSQKSPQPSLFPVEKTEKRRYGKYRHVLLTDDEGRKLRDALGEDLEDAVAILDEYIQSLPVKAKGAKKDGAKWWMQEYEAKDHYIVLHHGWARKRLIEMRTKELNAKAAELRYSAAETNAKAAEKRLENANSSSQPRQMYLTSDDISRRNAEEGWRQLQLMHQMEGNG